MSGGRMNWSRVNSRARMRRQGVEDVRGAVLPTYLWSKSLQPTPPRPPADKADRRRQLAAALMAWRAKRGQS